MVNDGSQIDFRKLSKPQFSIAGLESVVGIIAPIASFSGDSNMIFSVGNTIDIPLDSFIQEAEYKIGLEGYRDESGDKCNFSLVTDFGCMNPLGVQSGFADNLFSYVNSCRSKLQPKMYFERLLDSVDTKGESSTKVEIFAEGMQADSSIVLKVNTVFPFEDLLASLSSHKKVPRNPFANKYIKRHVDVMNWGLGTVFDFVCGDLQVDSQIYILDLSSNISN